MHTCRPDTDTDTDKDEHTHTHSRTHTHTHTHTHTRTHAHAHTRTQTKKQTHTHTCVQMADKAAHPMSFSTYFFPSGFRSSKQKLLKFKKGSVAIS